MNRGIIRVTILISHIKGLITLLITTHEAPSTGIYRGCGRRSTTRPGECRVLCAQAASLRF